MFEDLQEQTDVKGVVAQTGDVPNEIKAGLSMEMKMAVLKTCYHIMPALIKCCLKTSNRL